MERLLQYRIMTALISVLVLFLPPLVALLIASLLIKKKQLINDTAEAQQRMNAYIRNERRVLHGEESAKRWDEMVEHNERFKDDRKIIV